MSSLIFDYEVLGIGWEVIVQTLIGLCNVALDKDVCAGAIHNYAVSLSGYFYLPIMINVFTLF